MSLQSFGHPLHTLNNGVVGFADGKRFTPLVSMNISVSVNEGLAKVIISRSFENHEQVPIEAILTAPTSFQAVLTGLHAKINGRELTAKAQSRDNARASYEDAIDRGKLAILHEEPLRGLHIVSIAPLAPKQKVEVIAEYITALANIDGTPTLHIPTTVGELYGSSPLLPVDDVVAGPNALMTAKLLVDQASGEAFIYGALMGEKPQDIDLTKNIILTLPKAHYGCSTGYDAFGRPVSVKLAQEEKSTLPLNLIVLFDRSGSTHAKIEEAGVTVWSAMRDGLKKSLQDLTEQDAISIWQFDDNCQKIGAANGSKSSALVNGVEAPGGGTELGRAISHLKNNSDGKDILVLTDGHTWAAEAQAIAAMGYRISAVLVGEDSFEGVIGQLAFMTGGEIFPANGGDVASAITSALQSFRNNSAATVGVIKGNAPLSLQTKRSAIAISINWADEAGSGACNDIGKYAAALALPLIESDQAAEFATAHNLCTHLTSLLMIDEDGVSIEGVPEQRKVEVARRIAPTACYYAPDMSSSMSMSIMQEPLYQQKLARPRSLFMRLDDYSFDWDRLANQLLVGDVTGLDDEQKDLVQRLAAEQEIRDLADKLGLDPLIVAIGLLAKSDSGKTAERVARKILAQASIQDLQSPLRIAQQSYFRMCA